MDSMTRGSNPFDLEVDALPIEPPRQGRTLRQQKKKKDKTVSEGAIREKAAVEMKDDS